jgi:hypothetical protein
MSDNKLTDERGLYQVPDEPDAAPQGSVSAPVSAMGRADAPQEPSAAASYARGIAQMSHPPLPENLQAAIAQWFEDFAAARVAEAVAQERARIVAAIEAWWGKTGYGKLYMIDILDVIKAEDAP